MRQIQIEMLPNAAERLLYGFRLATEPLGKVQTEPRVGSEVIIPQEHLPQIFSAAPANVARASRRVGWRR